MTKCLCPYNATFRKWLAKGLDQEKERESSVSLYKMKKKEVIRIISLKKGIPTPRRFDYIVDTYNFNFTL